MDGKKRKKKIKKKKMERKMKKTRIMMGGLGMFSPSGNRQLFATQMKNSQFYVVFGRNKSPLRTINVGPVSHQGSRNADVQRTLQEVSHRLALEAICAKRNPYHQTSFGISGQSFVAVVWR